ncbi:PspC domain-containing protein [Companilactobacillus halodurans]|uniref:PspC domain-containing protein n=1 Tax=Companilactobacillus halodurans TaxID=2584183 RepID=A0A5P0ZX14_9LACO|nr:PspC domain-containing protein [Companilactobacillus halodurans]MQS76746.1 PspC domain-containing protein [Companilactobacillus halodurans]MQS97507.1 PspC domain-containing protein [Companilactobacillus halodurans]
MHIPVKRSQYDRILSGVIGGLCNHFDWNLTLGRIIYVLLTLTPVFPGILVYLGLWLLMEKPDDVQ